MLGWLPLPHHLYLDPCPAFSLDRLNAHTQLMCRGARPGCLARCVLWCSRAMWCPAAPHSLSPFYTHPACWGSSCSPCFPSWSGDSQHPAALSPGGLCSHRLVALGCQVSCTLGLLKQAVSAGFGNALLPVQGLTDAGCNVQDSSGQERP